VARRLERQAFRAADAVIVAAEADRRTIIDRYGLEPGPLHVIPNYVDTAVFRPMPEVTRDPGRITFIGRLDVQKNLSALLEAVEGLPGVELTVVGAGPLREPVHAAARRGSASVTFLGTRPHMELPALLNRSAVFVLPSLYEGNPKALIEAMACGVPVIGTRVPGIQELLVHRETGYLCGTDAALRARIGSGAVAYVREHCSLDAAVDRELAILRSL
jgi:glycosyltransferase involved in cell wall biosynthesis